MINNLRDTKKNYSEHLKAHNKFSVGFSATEKNDIILSIKLWHENPEKAKNPYQLVLQKGIVRYYYLSRALKPIYVLNSDIHYCQELPPRTGLSTHGAK